MKLIKFFLDNELHPLFLDQKLKQESNDTVFMNAEHELYERTSNEQTPKTVKQIKPLLPNKNEYPFERKKENPFKMLSYEIKNNFKGGIVNSIF